MEYEKINVPSSEINSANLSAEKEKDTEETSLNSPKVNSPSSETYLAKTHDKGKESNTLESEIKVSVEETNLIIKEFYKLKLFMFAEKKKSDSTI